MRYEIVDKIDLAELKAFYEAQHSAAPESWEKLARMVGNSACFIAARDESGRLVGIARGVTDGVRGYLTECKLDPGRQGPGAVTHTDGRIEHDQYGIAREMARRVLEALVQSGCERIDVMAYGTEVDFCEELGFKRAAGLVPMTVDARVLREKLTPAMATVAS